MRGEDSPVNYRTGIVPALTTTRAIENTNILNSLPAAPESTISSANPNFLMPGWPGGRMSLYLFNTLEFTRDVISIGGKTREEAQEDQPSNANLSFHSLPYKVKGSPCLSHESSNFSISRKLENSNVDAN